MKITNEEIINPQMKKFRVTNQEIENNKCHLNEEIGNPQMKKSKNTNEEFDNSTNEEIKKF